MDEIDDSGTGVPPRPHPARRARRRRGRLATWTLRAALLVAGLAIAFALLELGLRVSGIDLPKPPVLPGAHPPTKDEHADPLIGWRMRPNAVQPGKTGEYDVVYRSNAQGFRGPRDFGGETGFRNIAFIGDSFAYGIGVQDEETFVRRIESRFENVRSLNFGQPAFGIDQMWMTLRHYALRQRPDLVVLSFIVGDLERATHSYHYLGEWMPKPTFTLEGGRPVPLGVHNGPGAVSRWIQGSLMLYRGWVRLERWMMKTWAVGPTWRLNRAMIEACRDECRAAGVPFVVMYVPLRSWPKRVDAFEDEFRSMGIPFLDLAAHLPANPTDLWFPYDAHFTPAGHAFAAGHLAGFIAADRGWPLR